MGVSSLVIHDLEFAGRFVSVLTGSLLVIPVYYLGLKLYDKQTALVGGFIVATNAVLINYSTTLMAESTYNLVLTSAIVLGLFALSRASGGLFFLTGIAFGACYLVRPEAMGYLGLITLLALGGKIHNDQVTRKQIFPIVFCLCVGHCCSHYLTCYTFTTELAIGPLARSSMPTSPRRNLTGGE